VQNLTLASQLLQAGASPGQTSGVDNAGWGDGGGCAFRIGVGSGHSGDSYAPSIKMKFYFWNGVFGCTATVVWCLYFMLCSILYYYVRRINTLPREYVCKPHLDRFSRLQDSPVIFYTRIGGVYPHLLMDTPTVNTPGSVSAYSKRVSRTNCALRIKKSVHPGFPVAFIF